MKDLQTFMDEKIYQREIEKLHVKLEEMEQQNEDLKKIILKMTGERYGVRV